MLHTIKRTCAAGVAKHHQRGPGGSHRRPAECAGRCQDLLIDRDHLATLLATAWVVEPYVLVSWASAMSPRAVALRGDLTQAMECRSR